MTYAPKRLPLDRIPAGVASASDYERLAAAFLADPVLAYVAGGSGDDQTATANRSAFRRW